MDTRPAAGDTGAGRLERAMHAIEFDWEAAILARARAAGLTLDAGSCATLAAHARAVLAANPLLHLTGITRPDEFVERHLGESFEGAARLAPDVAGVLVDLGSGNGYPGLPLAVVRPGLRAALIEASGRKAEFLRTAVRDAGLTGGQVLERQVQAARDLQDLGAVRVVAARAVGGWERLLPKLAPLLADDGRVLLWAGATAETVSRRVAWRRRLTPLERHPLPGRDRSWVWVFGPAPGVAPA